MRRRKRKVKSQTGISVRTLRADFTEPLFQTQIIPSLKQPRHLQLHLGSEEGLCLLARHTAQVSRESGPQGSLLDIQEHGGSKCTLFL